jgi:hypothetical protein
MLPTFSLVETTLPSPALLSLAIRLLIYSSGLLPCLYCGTRRERVPHRRVLPHPAKLSSAVLLILFSRYPATHSHFPTFYDMTSDDRAILFFLHGKPKKKKKKKIFLAIITFQLILLLSLGIYQVLGLPIFFSYDCLKTLNRFEVGRSLGRRCEISL